MKVCLLLMSILAVFCSNAYAGDPCKCDVPMYIIDPDPAGSNLRDAPKGKVVFVLPQPPDTEPDCHSVMICDARDGWFKIGKIETASVNSPDPVKITAKSEFVVAGRDGNQKTINVRAGQEMSFSSLEMQSPLWIHGSLLETSYRMASDKDPRFYGKPSKDAKVFAVAYDPDDNVMIDKVKFIGCQDGWLQVLFTEGKLKGKKVWVAPENQCPNSLTTCP